ncbi:sugar ABC transporter permease [Enterococcus saccharolyticus]|uniref:Maltose/maltodextrin transport system permease protein n=1 Tax=Candidatus Enterococcus willemsii TaxID=1857215 RepID=A0ABQ6Z1I2_9ENTE|nr:MULTISPECIES: sugar ABC transporter permease [Enterococcus]KAF1305320.1 sugar ABC transporter permease [Enterococcus sp. CU12B]MCD5002989.1 sugar ABC transporter permease [Enterococcus saccharolyticus]
MKTAEKNPRIAMLLSIIPGLGQIYNRQLWKGIVFLAITIGFVIELLQFGIQAFQEFVSLGTTPMEDHSLFLLINGTLQIIITVIFLLFWFINLRDANKVAKAWRDGLKVNVTIKEALSNVYENGFAYLLTIPAYFVMTVAIIFPVLVTLFMAFTNYDFKHIPPATLIDWVGFDNFKNIFTLASYRATFGKVFSWTIIWTVLSTTLQISLGVFLAVIANQKFIKFKRIFGTIFLLPWAVPAFITIMSFSNIFNDTAGAINTQVIPFLNHLPFVDISALPWKTDPFWTKTAIIMIQGWLGFPYIYVMVTGILQSIPDDLYEAAKMDGANALQSFKNITLPSIFLVAAPTFITQYTGNFNNFANIYLFNEGGPGSLGNNAGNSDILISWIYKLTTGGSPQYSVAAAITLMISAIVIGISMIVFKRTNAFNMED